MIELRPSRRSEVSAQKTLWRTAFGDSEEYIDWFYSCCWAPEHTLVLLEDGKLLSMLFLLPQRVTLPGTGYAEAYYIYALATDPAARSKGYGRRLLRYTDDYLQKLGVDCATVVPAEPSLYKFFGTADFAPAFSNRKGELLRDEIAPAEGADTLEEATAEEYGRLREALLAGKPSVGYDGALLRYQQGICRMGRGGLYRLRAEGEAYCAAAEYVNEDSVLVRELLAAPEHLSRAMALLAGALPAGRYYVRTPALWDGLPGSYIQPFGMIKWYHEGKALLWGEGTHGYMGFGFD